MTVALLGFAALLTLSFLRVPIAFSMIIVGFIGMSWSMNLEGALANVGQTAFDAAINYELSVVPLFVLMGNFVTRARLSEELYTASNAFLGHRKGGLAMATIVACGGFSAVCGSSLATAATMSKVAMPSMRRYGYDDGLAAGAIAAGGTLGILIPPSVLLVIYGILTQTNIGKLFAAGVVPGIVGILFYLMAVRAVITIWPALGPRGDRTDWRGRLLALRDVWGVLTLFVFVMGGIYGGVFSPTEAAGIGAFGAFVFAVARRTMDLRGFYAVLLESASTTAMLFTVLIGALVFANFINFTTFPQTLLDIAANFEDNPWLVLAAILLIYVLLGCVFESLSMILLTVPIFFPLIKELGPGFVPPFWHMITGQVPPMWDLVADVGLGLNATEVAVWFGIVVVVITEISLITPPVGLNVFVLRGVLPDVRTTTIFRGVTAYWIADLFRLTLIVALPTLCRSCSPATSGNTGEVRLRSGPNAPRLIRDKRARILSSARRPVPGPRRRRQHRPRLRPPAGPDRIRPRHIRPRPHCHAAQPADHDRHQPGRHRPRPLYRASASRPDGLDGGAVRRRGRGGRPCRAQSVVSARSDAAGRSPATGRMGARFLVAQAGRRHAAPRRPGRRGRSG